MYNKNNNGPKIEPWGTPQVIVFLDDICSLIQHCCSLFDKYDSNHFSSVLEMPKRVLILFRRMPWFIESKAFLMSRKMTPFNFPLSMFSSQLSHIWMKFFPARELNDRQTFDWMNSIEFKASPLAKRWKYQTLNECINASNVILPIENYNLQYVDTQTLLMVLRNFFFAAREWNDRQTVDGRNSIKFKTTFVREHTAYLTLNEWVNTIVVISRSVCCCGRRHFQVLWEMFSPPQIPLSSAGEVYRRHKVEWIDQAENLCQMYVDFSYILVVFSYIDGFLGFGFIWQLETHRNSLLIMSLQFALVFLLPSFVFSKKRSKTVLLRRPPWNPWGVVLHVLKTIIWRTIRISWNVLFKSSLFKVNFNLNKVLQSIYLIFIFSYYLQTLNLELL